MVILLQVMSTSTLPHTPHGYGTQPGQHHPQMQQQQPLQQKPPQLQQKFPSQPDLQQRQTNYENYPGPRSNQQDDLHNRDKYFTEQPHYMNHAELRNQFSRDQQMQNDMRPTQSMGNLPRGEPDKQQRPDPMGLPRPKSEEFDRVHEWQQRNEMERRRMQQQQQQQQGGPGGYPPQMPGYSPMGEPHRPPGHPEDLPRSQMSNQPGQHQQPYYSDARFPPRDMTPPYDQRRPHEMDPQQRRHPSELTPKPQPAPKPGAKPDNRQQYPGMHDPSRHPQPAPPSHMQQQGPFQGYPQQNQGYPPSSQGYAPNQGYPQGSQPGYPPASQAQQLYSQANQPPHSAPPQSRYPNSPPSHDNHPVYSRPEVKRLEAPQQHAGRNQSPELPPPPPVDMPPDVPPPPIPDNDKPPDELPPPPPVNDYERQVQEEQDRMLRRMAGTGMDSRVAPQGQDNYDPRYKGYQADRPPVQPEQQAPHYQQQQQRQPPTHFGQNSMGPGYGTYQNLPAQQRGPGTDSPQQRPPYPYMPRQEPEPQTPTTLSSAGGPNRPPVAQKPRLVIKPSDLKSPGLSPWERDQKEKEKKRQEEEARNRLEAEVNDLERKPYLAPEEQDRLRKLRLEQEFQRRVQEMSSKDEDGDSDTDITDRASVSIP